MSTKTFAQRIKGIERNLGFGIGLRTEHHDEIFDNHKGVDFLELVSDNFMNFSESNCSLIKRLKEKFPLVLHGVGLSIGGPDPLSEDYLKNLMQLVELVQPSVFSDHLSYSSAFGVEYHDLIPLPFSQEAVDHVAKRIKQVQAMTEVPFIIENPSYYVEMPGGEMTEIEFLQKILEKADCGVLLDVNNIYVNSQNHGYDPYEYIDGIPPERVMQYHIAGHFRKDHVIIDTHGSHIIAEVFKLYEYTVNHLGAVTTLLEWDHDIPTLELLLEENNHVRAAGERAANTATETATVKN